MAAYMPPEKRDSPNIQDPHRIVQCAAFGFAVAVARTSDGGKSFQTLREGLPQEHAYDLVYRHGLDVDASGERLPPIYCLRFASGD